MSLKLQYIHTSRLNVLSQEVISRNITRYIRYLTIISHEGTTIYHYPFVKDQIDINLFSAFASAILTITNELDDELHSINMKKQKIFFQKIPQGVFILSVETKSKYYYVMKRLRMLRNSETIKFLLTDLDIGTMIHISEELDEEIERIFDIPQQIKVKPQVEEPAKDMLLAALQELESL